MLVAGLQFPCFPGPGRDVELWIFRVSFSHLCGADLIALASWVMPRPGMKFPTFLLSFFEYVCRFRAFDLVF